MTHDFTEVTYWQCTNHSADVGGHSQVNLFHERLRPMCTCMNFSDWGNVDQWGDPPLCEHIREAMRTACSWHSMTSPEPMVTEGVCPNCGKEAIPVHVAV
jgi:hypothetical protein